jgi:hypothetical protein
MDIPATASSHSLRAPCFHTKSKGRCFRVSRATPKFSLNAISPNPQPLDGFAIEVEEAKLEYVKTAKAGSLTGAEAVGPED